MTTSQQLDLLQQKKESHCEENIYLVDDKTNVVMSLCSLLHHVLFWLENCRDLSTLKMRLSKWD